MEDAPAGNGLRRPARRAVALVVFAMLAVSTTAAAGNRRATDLTELSLEQLMSTPIVTASRSPELLVEAPATVIVITRREILERGYTELSEILDDLPGMQVIRPYGATFFKDYWRGYRNTIGDPFLFLVDGLVMNHLYFNTADVMSTVPLSNIDRIEVVYGPASSVYGANAFMGVVNVITMPTPQGSSGLRGMLAAGSADAHLADLTWHGPLAGFELKVSARWDDGELDGGAHQRYEYTRDRYYSDTRLWGGFATDPAYGGRFSSPRRNRALDLRLTRGDLELGFMAYRLQSGYGLEYAADRAQNHGVWDRPDVSTHLRYATDLTPRVTSTSLLRYRTSDVADDSFWVEGVAGPEGERLVQLSRWESRNESWTAAQDFGLRLSSRLALSTGVRWEHKDLQKAYDLVYGPALPPAAADPAIYPFPDESADPIPNNRLHVDSFGVYLQARLQVGPGQLLFVGARQDHDSRYGGTPTVRGGYVGTFGAWTVKALYGEAYQEPNQRVLYGGWTGSGSDPTLDPERSRTSEVSLGRTHGWYSGLLSLYHVHDTDTVVNTTSGARNLGARSVVGADLHLQAQPSPPWSGRFRMWAYVSHLFRARERMVDASGANIGSESIGDLANTTVSAGATAGFGGRLDASLRWRWVSERRTVLSNPIGRVPAFTTVDAQITFKPASSGHVSVSLKVTNLFDETYAHPGVREASAGDTPGSFNGDVWTGSAGYFSSLLPQPDRAALLVLRLDL